MSGRDEMREALEAVLPPSMALRNRAALAGGIAKHLTAAGYRLLEPGQIDPETRERAAAMVRSALDCDDLDDAAAEAAAEVFNAGAHITMHTRLERLGEHLAAAIRSLGDGQ